MTTSGRLLIAATGGLVLAAAFAPFGLWPIAWVILVPLLFAIEGASPVKAMLTGWVYGFCFFLATVYWVVNSMYLYGGLGLTISVPLMLLLTAYLALFPALFAFLTRLALSMRPIFKIFVIPAFWVATEYARAHLFTGFPWVLLGYSQAPALPLIQVADITGVWGVSYIIILVNTAAYLTFRALRGGRGRFPVAAVVTTTIVLTATVGYGFMKLRQYSGLQWDSVRIAVAQGNIDQSVKWSPSNRRETIETYFRLSRSAVSEGARLVVWPETAVPFYPVSNTELARLVRGFPVELGAYVLTGGPHYNISPLDNDVLYYNSVFLLEPDPHGVFEPIKRYDKVHLVPFGEYVPFKRLLFFVDKFVQGVGDFSAGTGVYPLRLGEPGLGELGLGELGVSLRLGPLICFEAIFPELAREAVLNGANVLVNVTNDAWFAKSSAPYQHFDMSLFRAVENRVSLVRSANTGISAFIDPAGRTVMKTGLFVEASITADVSVREGQVSLYTRLGDFFPAFCIFITIICIIKSIFSYRRSGHV